VASTDQRRTAVVAPHPASAADVPLARFRASVRAQVGGLPGPFWLLFSGTFINRIGYLVEPFLAYYLTGVRGLPLATTGAVLAMSGAGSIVTQLVSGVLTDRIGRRAVLTFGMLANAAALIALGYSKGLPAIVAATMFFGMTIDLYRPASAALVADVVPPADRPRAYGLVFWAVNLGFSVAMVLGGALVRSGFVWLFWADAGTCAVTGVMAWLWLPRDRPRRASPAATRNAPGTDLAGSTSRRRRWLTRPAGFLGDPVMLAYLALTLCFCFVYLQSYTTLPLAMRLQGLSPQEYGLAMAVNGILIVTLQPWVSGWLGRRDQCAVLAAGFVVVGLGFGLTALAGSVLAYAATVAVWTLGEIITAGLGAAIVADLAPPSMRGRYSGAYGAIWATALLLAPLGGTRLLALGQAALWLTCGLLATAAAAGLLVLAPAIRRRSHAARLSGGGCG
jgi:MFS family permease